MKNIYIIIIAIVLLVTVNELSAQTIIDTGSVTNNRVYLSAGIYPATMLSFGYEHKFDISFLKRPVSVFAEVGVSITNFKGSELRFGGILPVFEKRNFKIINTLNVSAGILSTKNFDSKRSAIADEVAIGFYREASFIAITAGYKKIYLNKIEHTDYYRETYHEDAVDSNKGTGGIFMFGLIGGITIEKKYDILLVLKLPFTEKFNSYDSSPVHLNLMIGYSL